MSGPAKERKYEWTGFAGAQTEVFAGAASLQYAKLMHKGRRGAQTEVFAGAHTEVFAGAPHTSVFAGALHTGVFAGGGVPPA